MKAVREEGLSIPEDVSVIGFDDIPIAEYMTPALTTIRQDFAEMGYRSAELLHGMMQGKQDNSSICVPFRFVERDSVKKIRN